MSNSALFFDSSVPFSSLPLDGRVFKALARLHLVYPSLIQSRVIPLALTGTDLLCKASTGSGKTLAYAVPIVQTLLTSAHAKQHSNPHDGQQSSPSMGLHGVNALILVPSKELVVQVQNTFKPLLYYCGDVITMAALTPDVPKSLLLAQLKELPTILISTPALLLTYLAKTRGFQLKLDQLKMLVLDEADLLLSYGYLNELTQIFGQTPKLKQTMLMSATLSEEVEDLKSLVLYNPSIVKLEELTNNGAANGYNHQNLQQFYINVTSKDKYLLVYALLKLNVLKGKCLFYTNNNETSFRLKLFLELFSINAAVLNASLPFNSRKNILNQFNRGVFDYLIATDEAAEYDENDSEDEDSENEVEFQGGSFQLPVRVVEEKEQSVKVKEEDEENDSDNDNNNSNDNEDGSNDENEEDEDNLDMADQDSPVDELPKPKRNKRAKQSHPESESREFSSSRGLDFQDVSCVINFDLPTTYKCYTHRVGRTARGGKSGIALSLVSEEETAHLKKIVDEQLRQLRQYNLNVTEAPLKYLQFNMGDIEGFRYRVEDVSRGVTKLAVKEAILKDIKLELINSAKLKAHFEDNPRELDLLRHDKVLRPKKILKHLQHVPKYLVPANLMVNNSSGSTSKNSKRKRDKYKAQQAAIGANQVPYGSKKARMNADPLRNLHFTGGKNRDAKGNATVNNQPALPTKPSKQQSAMGQFSTSKVGFKESTAGRRKWKQRHQTGKGSQKKNRSKSNVL